MRRTANNQAFTLVELSIVLVIIGLLVGGVLAGQALIKGSQLRVVTAEYSRYQTAFDAFRDRYNAYPGDMPNATNYWPADAGCPGTAWDGVQKIATCNGNGDGNIATYVNPYTDFTELYRAWQQMADAGLIEGSYVGTSYGGFQSSFVGKNVPASKFPQGGWSLYPLQSAYTLYPTYWWNNDYNTVLVFGGSVAGGISSLPLLSGPDAWNIDTKMDDGKPGYGAISSGMDALTGKSCNTTNTQATQSSAAYNLANDQPQCMMLFKVN